MERRTATDEDVKSQKIVMEKLHLAFYQMLPDCPAIDANMKFRILELAAGGVVLAVQSWILDGHKADVRVERRSVEYPDGWWEFFKQDYAPGWFLRRWPVKMKKITYDWSEHHHFVCPHVAVKADSDHFIWMASMSGQLDSAKPMKEQA